MIPNNNLIVSSTEPVGNNRKKVWFQKFDEEDLDLEVGGIHASNGEAYENEGFVRTPDYINVEPNTAYKVSADMIEQIVVFEYDINNNFVRSVYVNNNNKIKFSTRNTTAKIKIRFNGNSININAQLYGLDKKIYIKNNNEDIYEEFIDNKEYEKGCKYISGEGHVGTSMWWRIATFNVNNWVNAIVLIQTNNVDKNGVGGYIGNYTLKVDCIANVCSLKKLADSLHFLEAVEFSKARLVYNTQNAFLEIWTNVGYEHNEITMLAFGLGVNDMEYNNSPGSIPEGYQATPEVNI